MKNLFFIFCFAFSFVAKAHICFGQKTDTLDFYQDIKKQDITEFILLSNQSIGFLGDDYQRFYIHFTSVQKNVKNPYQYQVKGKTKLKDNICSFTGTITVKTAIAFGVEDDPEIPQNIRAGKFTAFINLQEDKKQYGSGKIKGILTKGFILKTGKMLNDEPLYYGDLSYEGNCFQGQWTSYKIGKSKTCMWHNGGGWTIKQDLFHLGDDVDVYINLKYLKNGWENYVLARHYPLLGIDDLNEIDNAQQKEQEKWWKYKSK